MQDNVMVDSRGIVQLTDYGQHKLLNTPEDWIEVLLARHISVRWMAPELISRSKAEVTPQTDVYAYGMTCWVSSALLLANT
jgi:serine/threonine protein kinase